MTTGTRPEPTPEPIIAVVMIALIVFGGVGLAYWIGSHFEPEIHRKIVGGYAAFLFWSFIAFIIVLFAKRG